MYLSDLHSISKGAKLFVFVSFGGQNGLCPGLAPRSVDKDLSGGSENRIWVGCMQGKCNKNCSISLAGFSTAMHIKLLCVSSKERRNKINMTQEHHWSKMIDYDASCWQSRSQVVMNKYIVRRTLNSLIKSCKSQLPLDVLCEQQQRYTYCELWWSLH